VHFGLTRNANITGLDRIGIPVTLAIRPNGMSLSVSSGKGLTQSAAIVSGFMEAFELHHCENYPFPYIEASYIEMLQKYLTPHPSILPLKKNSIIHEKWPMRWAIGWDLISQQEIALPLTAISLDYRLAQDASFFEMNCFERTSNGVASGNHILEAISSAIYEIIERDAITCHSFAKDCYLPEKVILETIPFESVATILQRFKEAHIHVDLFDATVDTKVPVFEAMIYDQQHRRQGIASGYGAHLDPEVAMLRAITEAVQGRAAFISGARDDIFLSHFQLFKKFDAEKTIERLNAKQTTLDARQYQCKTTQTFEEEIHLLIDRLKAVGICHVAVYDLGFLTEDFSFVRVAIPGMEGYCTSTYKMGKRAHVFRQAKAAKEASFIPSMGAWHCPAGVVS
jgi:ribosomal protein S12 methylthiotransferase accessory factor